MNSGFLTENQVTLPIGRTGRVLLQYTRTVVLTGDRKRQYQLEWINQRRLAWIAENGPCARCGSSDELEVDHVDRAAKSMHPTRIWSRRKEARDEELAKCQVLCGSCHKLKTAAEQWTDMPHGTRRRYNNRGCRCRACTDAAVDYVRARRARAKRTESRT